MRLAELLLEKSPDELGRLALEYAPGEAVLPRHQQIEIIEGVLRSFRFIQDYLFNRQPPTFAIMTLLLEAPDNALLTAGFQDVVLAETKRISDGIDSVEILKRDEQLRVYRRALYQTRSNDPRIDTSELAILGVLRQELEIAPVEHFLIEHHADLREFWQHDNAVVRELEALRTAGLVFNREDRTQLPEDIAPTIRHALGIDMSRAASRRLFNLLSSDDLHGALAELGAPTSGNKDSRIERLVAHMALPRAVLRRVSLDTLRACCKSSGATISGSKPELVERIVSQFASGRDLERETEPTVLPPVEEPRRLNEVGFSALFRKLRGHELSAILGEFDLRRWGTKEQQVRTVWEAHRSESTLLSCLSNAELDNVLERLNLRSGGSKADRIGRLVEHYSRAPEATC